MIRSRGPELAAVAGEDQHWGGKEGRVALLTPQSGAIPFSAAMGWRSVTSVGFSGSKIAKAARGRSAMSHGEPEIVAVAIDHPP